MSALAMMLSAVLVTGNAPEKVSGEVEQRLNLSGEWQGTFRWRAGSAKARLASGCLFGHHQNVSWKYRLRVADDGNGRLRVWLDNGPAASGTYRREGGYVTLSFGPVGRGMPWAVLNLRRVGRGR